MFCFSKRAKNLVTLAQLPKGSERLSTVSRESSTSPFGNSPPSTASSPALGSPAPQWWDNIFEATDILQSQSQPCVRRKLFLSPLKESDRNAISEGEPKSGCVPCDTSPCMSSDRDANNDSGIGSDPSVILAREPKSDCVPCDTSPSISSGRDANNDSGLDVNSVMLPNVITPDLPVSEITCSVFTPSSLDCEAHSVSTVSTNDCAVLEPLSENVIKTMYPSHLKKFPAKLALNSGEKHITPRGRVRQGRLLRDQCQESCNRCLHPRLTQEERYRINKEFWGLKNHEEQWKFIAKSVIVSLPSKKPTLKRSKQNGKLSSRTYFFKIGGMERRVCKTTFKNTLCICDSRINSAISHSSESGMRGDQRGKHNNRPKRIQKTVRAST